MSLLNGKPQLRRRQFLRFPEAEKIQNVLSKARTACEISGHDFSGHFADVGKMVQIGSQTSRQIDDLMHTRFACYLIAQNGSPSKNQIAFAQTYFAIQTRRA